MHFALRPTSHPEMTIYFWRRRREVEGDNRHGIVVFGATRAELLTPRRLSILQTIARSAPNAEKPSDGGLSVLVHPGDGGH